jgi:1-deoxy-D-xylulose-5-phosphate synthase
MRVSPSRSIGTYFRGSRRSTIEEGSIGGFGSFVMQVLSEEGLFDGIGARNLKFRAMVLPDRFLDHDKPEKLYASASLDTKGIVAKVLSVLGRETESKRSMIA